MAGEDRGPLIAELSDGTQIYRNGILKSEAFFEVSFLNLTYESRYDLNSGSWGSLEEQDPKLVIPRGSATNIELAPGEDGDLIFNGGQVGISGRGFDAALVFNERGEVDHLLLGASIDSALGGVAAGFRVRDDGDNLSSYNTITVHPDGTIIEIVHTSGDSQYPGVKVKYSIYDANGELVNGGYTNIGDPDIAARMGAGDPTLRGGSQCFGPEVPIDMWPLDPEFAPDLRNPLKQYDQDAVRAKIWKKPIHKISVGDWVVSLDINGNMVPGYVPHTMTNDAKILLNFHGTRVTPGHVYYRPDSKKSYKYETLIDVLRDDGVIQRQDGTLIRAATNVPVDSRRDGFVHAVAGRWKTDGTFQQTDVGLIRLGTRFLVGDGDDRKSFAVADLIEHNGGVVGEDKMIHVGGNPSVPFVWDLGDVLPKPEDFVLACSGTTLEDIYKAAEWESQGPRLPAPIALDRGPVQPLKGAALSVMPRNEPLNVAQGELTVAKPQQMPSTNIARG